MPISTKVLMRLLALVFVLGFLIYAAPGGKVFHGPQAGTVSEDAAD